MVNPILENSVLNPDTSSLSLSIKSKGLRFISAKIHKTVKTIKGRIARPALTKNKIKNCKMFSLFIIKNPLNKRNLNLISYEIDCEIARKLAKKGYFDDEKKPINNEK